MIKPRIAAIDIKFTSPLNCRSRRGGTSKMSKDIFSKERGAVKKRSFINQNRIFFYDKAPLSGN